MNRTHMIIRAAYTMMTSATPIDSIIEYPE